MRLPLTTIVALLSLAAARTHAQSWVYLTEVPDYNWYAGCFGTASGNLMGFWDRHGMSNFYSGPTAGGVAPLNNCGGNIGIRSMWASKAGLDGRATDKPGHSDDYWSRYVIDLSCGFADSYSYESTVADPYVTAGHAEHVPDCIGDFIGLSQKKWTNLANECDGNIDAYSFVFWDKSGKRRSNFSFTNTAGQYIPDIQSGFKAWARYRGYDADVFTQFSDFNPERTGGGFTYEDVKAEINAGYPVCVYLQPTNQFFRSLPGMPKANPEIHGVMIYGYVQDNPEVGASKGVIIRTSWGSGDNQIIEWSANNWLGLFPPRGVIGFHPKPKITQVTREAGNITIAWDGPSAQLFDYLAGTTTTVHRYQVERASTLSPPNFAAVGAPTTNRTATVPDSDAGPAFYRVRLSP
jgi:hypothetical protein